MSSGATPQKQATIEDIKEAMAGVEHIENQEERSKRYYEELREFTPESIEKAEEDFELIDRARAAEAMDSLETLGANEPFPLGMIKALVKHPIKIAGLLWQGLKLAPQEGIGHFIIECLKAAWTKIRNKEPEL